MAETPEISFTREQNARKGRFVAHVAGQSETGEMLYTQRGEGRISLDHTEVPQALGGMGVAKALARYVIEVARAEGLKVIPLCPYFQAQVKRNPDWHDVIAEMPPH